jgi:hypothetical protein
LVFWLNSQTKAAGEFTEEIETSPGISPDIDVISLKSNLGEE